MLPNLSTYVVSVSLTDTKGNAYQFLWPTGVPESARNGPKKLRCECFIPCTWSISKEDQDDYFGLKKIAECFEEYKENEAVNLLFNVFTQPDYATNLGD